MMRLLVALMLIGSALGLDAGSQGAASIDALAGKWTVVPPKGEAPLAASEMTIEIKGGSVTVAMGAKDSPATATSFDGGKGAGTFLILKKSMAGGMATIIVRPAEADRVRLDYFVEYLGGSKNKNWYHSEVFARRK